MHWRSFDPSGNGPNTPAGLEECRGDSSGQQRVKRRGISPQAQSGRTAAWSAHAPRVVLRYEAHCHEDAAALRSMLATCAENPTAPADSCVELNGASLAPFGELRLGTPLQQENTQLGDAEKVESGPPAPREMSPPLFPRMGRRGSEKRQS